MKSTLLIDGQNLKGYIENIIYKSKKPSKYSDYKINWANYDFKKLFDKILSGKIVDKRVIYFSKLKLHPDTKTKSEFLIQERRLLKTHLERQEFEVIMAGSVRGNYIKNKLVFKEKGVDVRIAVDMVIMACEEKTKEIILASSDSDLQPAITEIKNRNIRFIYVGFQSNPNVGIISKANEFLLFRDEEVLLCENITKPLV